MEGMKVCVKVLIKAEIYDLTDEDKKKFSNYLKFEKNHFLLENHVFFEKEEELVFENTDFSLRSIEDEAEYILKNHAPAFWRYPKITIQEIIFFRDY